MSNPNLNQSITVALKDIEIYLSISRNQVASLKPDAKTDKLEALIDDANADILDANLAKMRTWYTDMAPRIVAATEELAPAINKGPTVGIEHLFEVIHDVYLCLIETSNAADFANGILDKNALDINYGILLSSCVSMLVNVKNTFLGTVVCAYRARTFATANSGNATLNQEIAAAETLPYDMAQVIKNDLEDVRSIASIVARRLQYRLYTYDANTYIEVVNALEEYITKFPPIATAVNDVVVNGTINKTYDLAFAQAVNAYKASGGIAAINALQTSLVRGAAFPTALDRYYTVVPEAELAELTRENTILFPYMQHVFAGMPKALDNYKTLDAAFQQLMGKIAMIQQHLVGVTQAIATKSSITLQGTPQTPIRSIVEDIKGTLLLERDMWLAVNNNMSVGLALYIETLKPPASPADKYVPPASTLIEFRQAMGNNLNYVHEYDRWRATYDAHYKEIADDLTDIDNAITTGGLKIDTKPITDFKAIRTSDPNVERGSAVSPDTLRTIQDNLNKTLGTALECLVKMITQFIRAAEDDPAVDAALIALYNGKVWPRDLALNVRVSNFIKCDANCIFDAGVHDVMSLHPPNQVTAEAMGAIINNHLDANVYNPIRKAINRAAKALTAEVNKFRALKGPTRNQTRHALTTDIQPRIQALNKAISDFWDPLIVSIGTNPKAYQAAAKDLLDRLINKNYTNDVPPNVLDSLRKIAYPQAVVSIEEEFESDYEQQLRLERERLLAPRAGPSDEELAYRLQMEEAQRASLATQSYAKYMEEMERRMREESAAKEAAREFIAAVPPHHDDVVRHEINVIRRESDNDADYFDKLAKIADVVARDAGESFAPAIELPALAAQVNKLLDKLGIPKYAEHEYNPLLRIALLKNIGKNKRLRELLGIEDKDVS